MNIYKLPYHSYSGIFTTFLLSTGSFGRSTFLHTKIIAYSNWEIISWIGLILEFLLILFLYFFLIEWKNNGISDLKDLLG